MGDADHRRRIASRISDGNAADESSSLIVDAASDGRIYLRCRVCPKKTRDIRGKGNRAFSSSHVVNSVDEAEAWFDAHRRTDMHSYYRDDPPEEEASMALRRFAALHQEPLPPKSVVPFKYARRYR